LARTWKLILVDQETVSKHFELLKGRKPLPLQHHESYPPKYYYDPTARLTYHVTESAQAILCEQTHPFTQLVDISPLRRLTFLDLIAEHQHPGTQTLPKEFSRWRFTRLESPHITNTPKQETSFHLTHTPEIEYQSALLPTEEESHSDSDTDTDSDTDNMAWDKEVKLNPPLEFSGSADKACDFLRQVELYLTCKKGQFKDDKACITWTLSFIRGGPGGVWAGEYIDKITGGATSPSWSEFKQEFKDYFFPKNKAQDAWNKLKRLVQGRSLAQDYITSFNAIVAMTDYPAINQIKAFKDGLLPSLKHTIMVTRDVLPTTLKAWQDLAIRLDQNKRTDEYKASLRQGKGRYIRKKVPG